MKKRWSVIKWTLLAVPIACFVVMLIIGPYMVNRAATEVRACTSAPRLSVSTFVATFQSKGDEELCGKIVEVEGAITAVDCEGHHIHFAGYGVSIYCSFTEDIPPTLTVGQTVCVRGQVVGESPAASLGLIKADVVTMVACMLVNPR